ncbi:conserved hypothetical protein [Trichophyton verrucosum HKI 0517]|uniref:Transglutaminase-like domain-containing protein n=1 Tax=Trichophyton verrucosum (strain HKI 0517) TaxID=663202 RepID=D4D6I4_TRIVH|nr:uncharacterized protein TRV_02709 [Trichophyton verrucosum HKI 0517]EFE42513.1 conserved hypothetical protein [Trichophyton verrucosum HKI 0517]
MIRGKEVLPPPVVTRTGQRKPPPPPPPSKGSRAVAAGPPLPPRNKSQAASSPVPPALPPRTPSDYSRSSSEYTPSSASVSSNSSSAEAKPNVLRVRAPAWDQTELPCVTPWKGKTKDTKDAGTERKAEEISHQPASGAQGMKGNVAALRNQLAGHKIIAPATPPPPKAAKPKLPPRMNSTPLPQVHESQHSQDRPLLERVESASTSQRKLPPPPPRGADLQKIKQFSFSSLNKTANEAVKDNTGCFDNVNRISRAPPPVPLASRPKLPPVPTSSKPQIGSTARSSTTNSTNASTICFKCRDFSTADAHAARFPRQSLPSHDLAWLSSQLTSPFPSPTDKARVIFTWLHHNVRYDVESFFQGKRTPQSPDHVFTHGLAVCAGFASLFEMLAKYAGLEAKVISGHGTGYGFKPLAPGAPIPPYEGNHAWNVVRIDNGQWKLIDCCWGAGHVEGANMPYVQKFSPKHFIMSNDEFGLDHYPENGSDFYREDGRTNITWEEYIGGGLRAQMHIPTDPPTLFDNAVEDHGIGKYTLQPGMKSISIREVSGRSIHFQFALICEHWSIVKHGGKTAASFFVLAPHGLDGREDKFVPFNHVRGTNAGGGGDYWYLDIPDGRTLGCAGQKLMIFELTSFGTRTDLRGLTMAEYEQGVGRVGMGFKALAEWTLVE